MKENKPQKITLKKRKENLKSSLGDIERFLYRMNKSIKCMKIFKNLK